jgi:membrane-associated phospholipid phosphatase
MPRTAGNGTPAAGQSAGAAAREGGAVRLTQPAPDAGREPRPLLAPRARPAAVAVTAACAAVIAVLGVWFGHQSRPGSLDRAAFDWLFSHREVHRSVLVFLAWLGTPIPVIIAVSALTLACLARRRWRGAVLAAVSVAVASGLTELVLKPLVGRIYDGFLSFPSGRATGAFSVAAVCAVLLFGPGRRHRRTAGRLILVILAVAVACAVAAAAVILRYHYLTDTIGGAAVGTGTVLATALIIDRLCPRLRQRLTARQGARRSAPDRTAPPGSLALRSPSAPARPDRRGAGQG